MSEQLRAWDCENTQSATHVKVLLAEQVGGVGETPQLQVDSHGARQAAAALDGMDAELQGLCPLQGLHHVGPTDQPQTRTADISTSTGDSLEGQTAADLREGHGAVVDIAADEVEVTPNGLGAAGLQARHEVAGMCLHHTARLTQPVAQGQERLHRQAIEGIHEGQGTDGLPSQLMSRLTLVRGYCYCKQLGQLRCRTCVTAASDSSLAMASSVMAAVRQLADTAMHVEQPQ